jgi:hypothetical protein
MKPIRAGITFFGPNAQRGDQPWCRGFTLEPVFMEHDVSLLGRDEFFRVFGSPLSSPRTAYPSSTRDPN